MRRHRTSTFRALIADCDTTMLIVGRFLALLELYRDAMVAFEQITPLGDLTIRWTGPDEGEITVTDEFEGSAIVETPASDVGERAEDLSEEVAERSEVGTEPSEESDEVENFEATAHDRRVDLNRQQGSADE
jgi:segregation and condensation protein A